MSHDIQSFARLDGTDPAWHGLGGVWAVDADIDEKLQACGLSFSVDSSPLIYRFGNTAKVDQDHVVLHRSDTGDVQGIVSKQFVPVQPRQLGEFLDTFANETDSAIDAAGCLTNGRFWFNVNMKQTIEPLPGDVISNYLLGTTKNDGTSSTRFLESPVRAVCQNTIQAAMSASTKSMSVSHRTDINWDKVRNWLDGEREDFALFGSLMTEFAHIPVNREQASEFLKELISPDWDGTGKAPRSLKAAAETMERGKGQREAGATVYGLLNGVTRHIDHVRGHNQTTRFESAMFGQGSNLKTAALDLLVKNCVTKWGNKDQLVPVLAETRYKKLLAA